MPIANFPARSSVRPLKEQKLPPDLKDITISHVYEDKGASFNTTGANAPQRWALEYGVLSSTLAAILDTHFESAGFTEPFSFVDRYGVTHTNVRYLDYDADHVKIFTEQSRRVVLIKRPA